MVVSAVERTVEPRENRYQLIHNVVNHGVCAETLAIAREEAQ